MCVCVTFIYTRLSDKVLVLHRLRVCELGRSDFDVCATDDDLLVNRHESDQDVVCPEVQVTLRLFLQNQDLSIVDLPFCSVPRIVLGLIIPVRHVQYHAVVSLLRVIPLDAFPVLGFVGVSQSFCEELLDQPGNRDLRCLLLAILGDVPMESCDLAGGHNGFHRQFWWPRCVHRVSTST
jgi:hypothetical protein